MAKRKRKPPPVHKYLVRTIQDLQQWTAKDVFLRRAMHAPAKAPAQKPLPDRQLELWPGIIQYPRKSPCRGIFKERVIWLTTTEAQEPMPFCMRNWNENGNMFDPADPVSINSIESAEEECKRIARKRSPSWDALLAPMLADDINQAHLLAYARERELARKQCPSPDDRDRMDEIRETQRILLALYELILNGSRESVAHLAFHLGRYFERMRAMPVERITGAARASERGRDKAKRTKAENAQARKLPPVGELQRMVDWERFSIPDVAAGIWTNPRRVSHLEACKRVAAELNRSRKKKDRVSKYTIRKNTMNRTARTRKK